MSEARTFTVHVDVERCIGAGHCVMRAPKIFDQREDGIVILLDPHPLLDQLAAAEKAADLCPSQVITIDAAP